MVSNSFNEDSSTDQFVSHEKQRRFKTDKITMPRKFCVPEFIKQRLQNNNLADAIKRPLVVEIGAGKGKHALQYAEQHKEHDIIAIERTLNKFQAFEKQTKIVNLPNLYAVHADAIPFCVFALPPNSVDILFILYPNPEPKNPNQQWLNMPFFEFLLSRLKVGGKMVLASNIATYIDNAYHQAIEVWKLPTEQKQVPVNSVRTHFEIKYLQRGETCLQLNMTKPDDYRTYFDDFIAESLLSL